MNAVGHYIPPMFIFPRKRMKPELLEKVPEGSIGGANPTVWINSELFETWFDDFTTCVQPKSRTRPTLLVLDGQKSRTKSASLIDKARKQRDNSFPAASYDSQNATTGSVRLQKPEVILLYYIIILYIIILYILLLYLSNFNLTNCYLFIYLPTLTPVDRNKAYCFR